MKLCRVMSVLLTNGTAITERRELSRNERLSSCRHEAQEQSASNLLIYYTHTDLYIYRIIITNVVIMNSIAFSDGGRHLIFGHPFFLTFLATHATFNTATIC